MIAEPPKNTASTELSEYEKDRVAWNLPQPKGAPPPAWRRLQLPLETEAADPSPEARVEPS